MMYGGSYTVVGILKRAEGGIGGDFVVVKEKRQRLLTRDAT